jgi:Papain-like cysteine protease AvrRpt2
VPSISSQWAGHGQVQQQQSWCWAATTSTLIDCFGGNARTQAQIVHDWLMSPAAEIDEIVTNYRLWIDSFEILVPSWENVQASVESSPAATTLMSLANGNSLPGVVMAAEDLTAHDIETIGGLLLSGVLYVLGSADHWYILYGADGEAGELLVWDPNAGEVTRDLTWLQGLNAYLVTGYNAP